MQFVRRTLIGLFLLSATIGLLIAAAESFRSAIEDRMSREERRRPARERVAAVNTIAIEPGRVVPTLSAFGEVLSRRSLELRTSAGGRVVFLADDFEDGALVQQGTLLAQIDPTGAEGDLAVARTDLAEAEADLRDAQRTLELARDELTAEMGQAELRAQALARQQSLADRGVGTASAVETAQLAEASAQQAVLTRRINVADAQSRIDQAKNTVSRARIALQNAERDLADTEIRAAFTGAVTDVSIVAGGLVTLNEQIATLVDPESLEVAFRVSTPQFTRLLDRSGQPIPASVRVTLDVMGLDLVTTGRITRVGATVGEGQTGRRLFARLDQTAGFRPGDFVSVAIEEPALSDVARVPATAIDAANTLLVINDENRLDRVSVEMVRRQGDDVLVRAPTLAGRRVVSERSPLLGAGILVRDLTGEQPPQVAGGPPAGRGAGQSGQGNDRVTLTPERRAKLIAAVQGNTRMPAEIRDRMLAQLQEDTVPARVVARIEERMGG